MVIRTLKGRLILIFTLILILAAVSIFVLYSGYSNTLVEHNLFEAASSSIRFIMDNVDRQLDECRNLSDWFFVNRDIDKILIRDYDNPINNLDRDMAAVTKTIADHINSSTISDDILGIIIQGVNGIRLTNGDEAYNTSMDTLLKQDWLIGSKDRVTFSWVGLQENPASPRINKYCLPTARAVIYSDTRKPVGWQYASFSVTLIERVLRDLKQPEGYSLFLIDRAGSVIYSNQPGLLGTVLDCEQVLSRLGEEEDDLRFSAVYQGRRELAFTARSAYGSFFAVQLVDSSLLDSEKAAVSRDALRIILVIIALGSLLAMLITVVLTRPIGRLMKRMQAIARGDFNPAPDIEGGDELGMLGKGMNRMAADLKELIVRAKDDEKKKSALEFKVLQNQINPHFVYNVLNSVRTMAQIQKSSGIYDMVTSLGVLLRESSKGVSDLITLKEEIYLLEKYMDIQTVRRNGLLKADFDVAEDALPCLIPKFTLQPIVENAIVHGLAEKHGIGVIEVKGWLAGETLCVTIRDNGIGIDPDKLPTLLVDRDEDKGLRYSGIGLSNIAQRLRMVFGDRYSMEFSSEPGVYTLVSLCIPATRKEAEP